MLSVLNDIPHFQKADGFPRIVHLTWKNSEIPNQWNVSKPAWERLHPEWLIILWTDEMIASFVKFQCPSRFTFWNGLRYNIQKVDVFRYLVLEKYGGVYCDLDIEPIHSIDSLIDAYFKIGGRVLLSESGVHHKPISLTNAFMVSVPNHPYWTTLWKCLVSPLKYAPIYKNVIAVTRHFTIIMKTGPGAISDAYMLHRHEFPSTCDAVLTIPRQFFQPNPHWTPKPCTAPGAYVRLLTGGSWHGAEDRLTTILDHVWHVRDMWIFPLCACFVVLWIVFMVLYCKGRKHIKI